MEHIIKVDKDVKLLLSNQQAKAVVDDEVIASDFESDSSSAYNTESTSDESSTDESSSDESDKLKDDQLKENNETSVVIFEKEEEIVPKLTEKEIISLRFHSRQRLQLAFESIYSKYGRNLEAISDVIDLETETVVVDNGHLRRHKKHTVGSTWKGLEGKIVNDALMVLWRQGALKIVDNVNPKDLEVGWYPSALGTASPSLEPPETTFTSNWANFKQNMSCSVQRLQTLASSLVKDSNVVYHSDSGDFSGPENDRPEAGQYDNEIPKEKLSVLQRLDYVNRFNMELSEKIKRKMAIDFYNSSIKKLKS